MFEAWGRALYRRRRLTLGVTLVLVPATMRLLGRANWWAPRPLRRLYARYGIKEEIPGPVPMPARVEG